MKQYSNIITSLVLLLLLSGSARAQNKKKEAVVAEKKQTVTTVDDRVYWSQLLYKIASPVVLNLAEGTLKKNMPLEKAPGYGLKAEQVTYLHHGWHCRMMKRWKGNNGKSYVLQC